MKKWTIISAGTIVLAAIAFTLIRASLVTYSIASKGEMAFCASPYSELSFIEPADRKLIKTGDLEFECDSIDETRALVDEAIKEFGGFVSDERLSVYEKRSSQWLEIRVPAEHFDALVGAVSKGVSRLDSRSVSVEDVTDRYYDTQTRLEVRRELEVRYRELLAEAETVKDMLAIEEQIAELREEIESAEGQLKRLNDRIALSTLKVTFYEKMAGSPVQFSKHFRNGVGNGWENLIWSLVGIVNIWPFIVILVSLIFGIRIIRKRRA